MEHSSCSRSIMMELKGYYISPRKEINNHNMGLFITNMEDYDVST